MKIISKFKDYYDGAAGMSIDKTQIYVRTVKKDVVKIETQPACLQEIMVMLREMPFSWELQNGVIGFCGRLYPFSTFKPNGVKQTFFSSGDLKKFCEGIKRKNHEWHECSMILSGLATVRNLKKRVKYEYPKNYKFSIEPYLYLKTPIFLILDSRAWKSKFLIITNPHLQRYNFQRIKDCYTTFQDISMFLGNQMASINPDPNVNISDKDMRDMKGFNEWSFRRHKEESKKFRKKRQPKKKLKKLP